MQPTTEDRGPKTADRPKPDADNIGILWFSPDGVERHTVDALEALMKRQDGFVWVDIPECDDRATDLLANVFGFHPLAVRDCLERSHVPKVHAYRDHVYLALHAPEPGSIGQVHVLEFNQFVGQRYLVTVHEPLPGAVIATDAALRETRAVLARIEAGRFRPGSPMELTYAIVSALARRIESYVWALAGKVAALERRVMSGESEDSTTFLEDMFRLRHELLTIRTIAAQSRELYGRMAMLAPRFISADARPFIDDLLDQFDRVRSMCDGEKEFLQGVVDFYQTRTATKMHFAMQRIALLTALVMPVTAVASIYGMNIIVSDATRPLHLGWVLGAMTVMTLGMLGWAKRQGWW